MTDIDTTDAPKGYVAVACEDCIGCAFDDAEGNCQKPNLFGAFCAKENRNDGCSVIFKKAAEYLPDLQAAVDARLREAQCCTSCGKQFVDHMGIIGTCAKLKESEAKCRHLDHTATLAKERADKAEKERDCDLAEMRRFQGMVINLTQERDAAIERADALEEEIIQATKTHGEAVAFYLKERDAIKAALRDVIDAYDKAWPTHLYNKVEAARAMLGEKGG